MIVQNRLLGVKIPINTKDPSSYSHTVFMMIPYDMFYTFLRERFDDAFRVDDSSTEPKVYYLNRSDLKVISESNSIYVRSIKAIHDYVKFDVFKVIIRPWNNTMEVEGMMNDFPEMKPYKILEYPYEQASEEFKKNTLDDYMYPPSNDNYVADYLDAFIKYKMDTDKNFKNKRYYIKTSLGKWLFEPF